MKTVEELQASLRSPRSVVREQDLDPRDELSGTTVFRSLPDGRCRTWVREEGIEVHPQVFGSEEEAVAATAGRIFGTLPQPQSVRELQGPRPTTVEEVKDALAGLGRDPDTVTRAEVLRWSPQFEAVTVVETHDDGTVRTYLLERGREHDSRDHPDEAAAVVPLVERLERLSGTVATDLDVERMRARVERHRRLMSAHAGRARA